MGVVTFERKITTSITPARIFKVLVLEADDAIPKILPQVVKSVEILEGDGGPGTIKKTNFAEGSESKFIKTKIEVMDKDNLTHCYSVIGGDQWNDVLEKISYETIVVAAPDGGSIIKTSSKYYPKENYEIIQDQVKAGAQKALEFFKAVEAYLLANPDAFN
ncbi:hypothetical protein P3X46_005906 [Hevea brasiliensis]|uniref:Uncharacterized protein n=2 Tax=Hevea brasiliensis TaxID=3981 RepID=A0A6A6KMF5_HEVBR|nr:major allergen Pru ar 1-like [Hevea brasiliensis]KAF2289128.1 hypothetical protein GH714_029028 [Hevea brasiliensis]KAJ9181859.1 hypothetical protein P3X46_005906 [Hevea brasiliensis]